LRFPDANKDGLKGLFESAGFDDVMTVPLEIITHFRDFDDYWKPFLGGQGPAPTYVLSLEEANRSKLRETLQERLPVLQDGSIPTVARAWAAKGRA
jgi:hypothetical protein